MEKMLSRHGLEAGRARLPLQAILAGRTTSPLTAGMNRNLAGSAMVLMDETTVEVLSEKRGKEAGAGPPGKSYMRVMRGCHKGNPILRFAYFSSRPGSCADSLLKGFRG
jgi:hypothetical protein